MQPPYGFVVGGKWYAKCQNCYQHIRLDKPLFGSLHICLTDEELALKTDAERHAFEQQLRRDQNLWDILRGIGNGLG